ncbi:hypothetical protein THAOC_08373, partial [Thalassiosira oceanica]
AIGSARRLMLSAWSQGDGPPLHPSLVSLPYSGLGVAYRLRAARQKTGGPRAAAPRQLGTGTVLQHCAVQQPTDGRKAEGR